MEEIKQDVDLTEQRQLRECARKMLENIELQIQVTYDYEQLKALYHHREVIRKMISNLEK